MNANCFMMRGTFDIQLLLTNVQLVVYRVFQKRKEGIVMNS
jgi:hypothetical protein